MHILRKHAITIKFLLPAVLESSVCSYDHYVKRVVLFSVTVNCYHLVDPGVDGRIILRWIFRKLDVGVWTGPSWLRIGTGGGNL
jgi:hypothetical protein